MIQEVVLLQEYELEILQRRILRPQAPREAAVLARNREQEHVINRHEGPQQDRNADQDQGRFIEPLARVHLSSGPPDRRLTMKYTSGSTNGSAVTMVAIAMSSWSSRR